MADHSAALLQQIKTDLEGQGVVGALAADGSTLTVDVAGRSYTISVEPGADDKPVG